MLIGWGQTAANFRFGTSVLISRACVFPPSYFCAERVSTFPLKCNLIVNTFLQSSFCFPHFLFFPHSPKRKSLGRFILFLSPLCLIPKVSFQRSQRPGELQPCPISSLLGLWSLSTALASCCKVLLLAPPSLQPAALPLQGTFRWKASWILHQINSWIRLESGMQVRALLHFEALIRAQQTIPPMCDWVKLTAAGKMVIMEPSSWGLILGHPWESSVWASVSPAVESVEPVHVWFYSQPWLKSKITMYKVYGLLQIITLIWVTDGYHLYSFISAIVSWSTQNSCPWSFFWLEPYRTLQVK